MDIIELRKQKRTLELCIQSAIKVRLDDFKLHTKITPNAINISMIDVTNIRSDFSEFEIGQVEIHISLD